jgi:hypothetical protein
VLLFHTYIFFSIVPYRDDTHTEIEQNGIGEKMVQCAYISPHLAVSFHTIHNTLIPPQKHKIITKYLM